MSSLHIWPIFEIPFFVESLECLISSTKHFVLYTFCLLAVDPYIHANFIYRNIADIMSSVIYTHRCFLPSALLFTRLSSLICRSWQRPPYAFVVHTYRCSCKARYSSQDCQVWSVGPDEDHHMLLCQFWSVGLTCPPYASVSILVCRADMPTTYFCVNFGL